MIAANGRCYDGDGGYGLGDGNGHYVGGDGQDGHGVGYGQEDLAMCDGNGRGDGHDDIGHGPLVAVAP